MFRPVITGIFFGALIAVPSVAQERDFTLSSPQILEESGFLQFLLPRFSLKTGVGIDLQVDAPQAEAIFNTETGIAVMAGLDSRWFLTLDNGENDRTRMAQRFADWLVSDIGQRTINQFTLDGTQVFTAAEVEEIVEQEIVLLGDVSNGEVLAFTNCARCHEIGTRNLMKGLGSTPSFGLLRGFPDWQERFSTFYLRAPHPAITQIEGVTPPFDPAHPPTIEPLYLTKEAVDDILTFVATVTPLDLGAPLVEHQ